MAPVFSKNAILVGIADYFCIVCEIHLKSEKDTDIHISKPVHQKQLEAIQYVEEFKAEGIKKIKNKYFCELCNKLLTVLARVRLHVTEQSHVDNKNKNSFKRVGNYIIAFEKVAICDQSWNGLSENSCAICNIEYDKEDIHKNQTSHILNVIQIQVEIDGDQNLYRKIDELSFHCLTCNTVLGLNSLTSHVIGEEHKKLYQACCDAYNKIPLDTPDKTIKDETTKSETIKKEATTNDAYNKILLDTPDKTIKDETTKSETIKKEATKNDPKSIENDKIYAKISTPQVNNLSNSYTNKAKENVTILDYDEIEDKIYKGLKCKDYVVREESQSFWCILCDDVLLPALVSPHVNGKHHQTILKLHKKRLQQMKNNNTNSNEKKDAHKNTNMTLVDSDKILDKLDDFQKYEIRVNFESKTAFCKKCDTHIDFVCEAIEEHILKHKGSDSNLNKFELKATDTKRTLFSSPVRVKRNNDAGNKNDTAIKNGTPIKNDVPIKDNTPIKNDISNKDDISSSKDAKQCVENAKTSMSSAILEALSSNNNKDNIPKNVDTESNIVIQVSSPKPKKPKAVTLNRVPTKMFVKNLGAMQHLMFKDVVVNDKYCINYLCFSFLVELRTDMFRCQLCEVCIHAHQFDEHFDSPRHSESMNEAPVIVNDDSEFIREIRSESFHCGFCNCVETSWEAMETHLKSSPHKVSKNSATWRREVYQSRYDTNPDFERIIADRVIMNAIINRFL